MDERLRRHYEGLPRDGGFAARCAMEVPREALFGARIVDVGCRRGRGCYKLSEFAGPCGRVTGIDWNASFVDEARAGVAGALERSGFSRSNVAFAVGYPEELTRAVAPESVDYVYLNSSLSLFADPPRALRECCAVLTPGGKLLAECVVADTDAGPAERALVAHDARRLGNAVQAAPTRADLLAWLVDAGFEAPVVRDGREVRPDEGSVSGRPVPVVEGDAARYRLIALEAMRPRL